MKNFKAPEEDFYIGYFKSARGKKKSKVKREWHLYPRSKKLFVNLLLAGNQGFLCAHFDGIGMYRSPNNKDHLFVDIDWMIEEPMVCKENSQELKRLKGEVLMSNKDVLEDEAVPAQPKIKERD